VPVPLSQTLGMVAGVQACASSGACIVLPSEEFDPGAVLEAVEVERCTALLGTSRMFAEELAYPGFERFDLTALRAALIGGGQCSAAVLKGLRTAMGIEQVAVVV
jgi:fatty-acyl-CoA synthase